jgi:alkylation response protein AidB-like acyl-CoA dehydrogenase
MTDTLQTATPLADAGFAAVQDRFSPIFARIAEGAVARDHDHTLPHEQVAWLLEAGFAALRVPVAEGGSGLSFREFGEILTELAAADSNIPQVFRGHIAFVEHVLSHPDLRFRDRWVERFVRGEFVGNAWTEIGSKVGETQTRVSRTAEGAILDGAKYYTTGSIFAQWLDVLAVDEQGVSVSVLVRRDASRVEVVDDWDGFGQQLTGSGTATFRAAEVDPAEIELFAERFSYQTALYQWVLLSVLAGIGRAVLRDAVEQVTGRTRVYSHGNAPRSRDDGQIQAVVGQLSAVSFSGDALLGAVADELDRAAALEPGLRLGDEDVKDAAARQQLRAELASARAQVILSEQVPSAATRLFDTLGASATSRARSLDRHWRNARTVASHNPVIFKQRAIGAWELNGTEPELLWSVGTSGNGSAQGSAK